MKTLIYLQKIINTFLTFSKKHSKLIMITLSCIIFLSSNSFANANEFRLKAAYIRNFTLFVDWPSQQTTTNNYKTTFNIGVISNNGIGDALIELAKQKLLKQKQTQVSLIENLNDLKQYNIIYITNSAKHLIPKIIELTKSIPVLLISETKNSAQKGVHINFFKTTDQYLRFEINTNSFTNSHLRVSSRLLKLAKIIEGVK
jgi:hypothetical protein